MLMLPTVLLYISTVGLVIFSAQACHHAKACSKMTFPATSIMTLGKQPALLFLSEPLHCSLSTFRLLLTNSIHAKELAALYTKATALVLPSEEEGFGLPVLEALACGTPAAAFNIEALNEQHADASDVALVEPGNFDALLEAAGSLAGRRATPPTRTWSEVAADTWSVYERALSSA